jgi:protein-S-isoprenylcysteine O-methyltransferase Ste14
VILAVTLFVLKAKGLFDRVVASLFLVFHWFPALAWVLEPALYVMVFPVGVFVLLCSPLNPLFVFPLTRELLEIVILDIMNTPIMLWVLGMSLFPLGLIIFTVALIQLLKGKGLVKTGLYSVVRHPQYLGILAASIGFLFLGSSIRLVPLLSWVILILAYIWLSRREEALLQDKYGDEYLAYKRRVPLILLLLTKVRS